MKQLHKSDLFGWSEFNQERNLDFHSVIWIRELGNIVVDPLPMTDYDAKHFRELGGANIIVITNSDHIRDAKNIAEQTGAKIYGPVGEKDTFPIACDHWVSDKEEIVNGLTAYQLDGSKTPGEIALLLEDSTLITGDLVRCHRAGELCLLPDAKLSAQNLARQSVIKLANIASIDTVLTGDGWPVFKHGSTALNQLVDKF